MRNVESPTGGEEPFEENTTSQDESPQQSSEKVSQADHQDHPESEVSPPEHLASADSHVGRSVVEGGSLSEASPDSLTQPGPDPDVTEPVPSPQMERESTGSEGTNQPQIPIPPSRPKTRKSSGTSGSKGGTKKSPIGVVAVAALVSALVSGGTSYLVSRHNQPITYAPAVTSPIAVGISGNSPALDIPQILGKVNPAVVDINTSGYTSSGYFGGESSFRAAGTGMIISSNGLVLTNNHVIANATSIKVTLYSQTKQYSAIVVGADPAHDVAVIKIQGVQGLPTVTFGSSASLKVGDPVVAVGNALALQGSPTVTQGIVSGLHRSISAQGSSLSDLIQTDAPINPGNSGGPLLNSQAQVIGMNTAIISGSGSEPAQNIGFAESIDSVLPIVKQIEAHPGSTGIGIPAVQHAYLGVGVETVTPALDSQLGLSTAQLGALVDTVVPNSPASQAGLSPGDIITQVANQQVASASDLVRIVQGLKSGQQVSVVWVGINGNGSQTVTLGSSPTA